jgi:cell division septum initiation protein DivIVA
MNRKEKQDELNRLLDLIERTIALEDNDRYLASISETTEKVKEHSQAAANWRADRLQARLDIHRLVGLE